MFKNCKRCNKTGFWFNFFTSFEGLYLWTPDLCKKCANNLRWIAVMDWFEKNDK